tara:strand:- start:1217 stop:1321 length:105 start_codon:yes stop_codon:yes gene_type:complete
MDVVLECIANSEASGRLKKHEAIHLSSQYFIGVH